MELAKDKHRIVARVSNDLYKQIQYWAARNEMSENEYFVEAMEMMIRKENQDYDLPTLEVQRLNQLVDVVTVLSSNVQSLESVVTSGFDSLLGLTRGDNYLLEDEDGEL